LIYFTDGHAATPEVTARFPILWVISKEGIAAEDAMFEALPGRKAKLQEELK
jgi:predicted metal-dependent peptidase